MKNSEKFRFFSIISNNFDFIKIFEKISIWVEFSKNFDFVQIFETTRFRSKFSKIFISKIFENFRFQSNSRIISILVTIFEKKIDFGKELRKISMLVKFSKNFDLGQIFENLDFGKNFENSRF